MPSKTQDVLIVIFLSLLVAVILTAATWKINFWPSDAKAYYFEPALKLPQLKYLSQIHELMDSERVRWLHGKEILILMISWAQRLLGDTETLRPLVLMFIACHTACAVWVFLLARAYWGRTSAWICYGIYSGSFWPYMYILFAKHQLLGLFFFLLAVWLAQKSERTITLSALAGLSMGCAFFSSTTAPAFLPLFAGALSCAAGRFGQDRSSSQRLRRVLMAGVLSVLGMVVVVLFVNWPHPLKNLQNYFNYVAISKGYNHFFYNQPFLQQWFLQQPLDHVRAGWEWIVKYFLTIMPVVFPAFLLAQLYVLAKALTGKSLRRGMAGLGFVLLSWSPVLVAEAAGVAQYGGNYFPAFVGIILLLGYAVAVFDREGEGARRPWPWQRLLFGVLLAGNIILSVWVFATDIYPCRMATTLFSRHLKEQGIKRLYTYQTHPHKSFFVPYLNPEIYEDLAFQEIDSLVQAQDGYVFIPPLTGESIYVAATSSYIDFDTDDLLNEMLLQGVLSEAVSLSVPTLASSAWWLHEEEILSYRKLILGHDLPVSGLRGNLLLLDGREVARNLPRWIPRQDLQRLRAENIRNVGTAARMLLFKGFLARVTEQREIRRLGTRLYRVGSPRDSLIAYVYKLDDKQPVWVPAGPRHFSEPLSWSLDWQQDGQDAFFLFPEGLRLDPGLHLIMIYRAGPESDRDHYRVAADKFVLQ